MLVASRSILKSCQYHHLDPRSSSPIVGFPLIPIPSSDQEITIYICSSAINDFVINMLPTIKVPFRLVSGDSDTTIPNDFPEASQIILRNPNLIGWWSQNCVGKHPNLYQIPIGLDYHTLENAQEGHSWGPQQSIESQEKELTNLKNNSLPFFERKKKCYSNFHFLTTTRYAGDRLDAMTKIPTELIDYEPNHIPRTETWKKMVEYAFIPSPHGNGLDCHRTWEAICLGCIPIVKSSPLDPLFDDLPVWIVSDWRDVTEDNMELKIEQYKKKQFNFEKLTLNYWINNIRNGRKKFVYTWLL
jgi:hypothetical protein